MNRIVLIGNGFDLAHGLKTSYADFINWYWEQWRECLFLAHSNILEDPLCTIELNTEKTEFETWHGFLFPALNEYRKQSLNLFYNTLANNKLMSIKRGILLTKICNSVETKGWVDIEADYYALLKEFVTQNNREEIEKLHEQFTYLQEKLVAYLEYVQQTCKDKKLASIRQIVSQPINERDIAVSALRNNLNIPLNWDEDVYPSDTLFLSFNYTLIAEDYVNNVRGSINHIHGVYYRSQSVIFGYGDEMDKHFEILSDINDNEYLRNIKSIRYLESDNYRKLLQFVEAAPYQIYIMGHSCGNSDRTLLNTLFEHENCVSIKPFYYVKPDGTDNYRELVQNISRNFKNKQSLRDKVVNKEYCEQLI